MRIAAADARTFESGAGIGTMAGIASAELITDLEAAAAGGSPERRVLMLRRVTNLFLSSADRLNEHQINVFDDVIVRLMQRIEAQSLAQFSPTFADLTLAPEQAVRHLACHEDIAVAAPVLIRSRSLSDSDLVAIASKLGSSASRASSVGRVAISSTSVVPSRSCSTMYGSPVSHGAIPA